MQEQDNQLKQVNLRLKQLVALKTLESIHEGHNLFYDYTLANDDYDEASERERILNDEAIERYQREFNEATEELDRLADEGKK